MEDAVFIWRPNPFRPRPQLSDFLFIAELYNEGEKRALGARGRTNELSAIGCRANSGELPMTSADCGPSRPSHRSSNSLMLNSGSSCTQPRRDRPDEIAQVYAAWCDYGDGDALGFDRVRPCYEDGMDLRFPRHVGGERQRVLQVGYRRMMTTSTTTAARPECWPITLTSFCVVASTARARRRPRSRRASLQSRRPHVPSGMRGTIVDRLSM